jgi:photosystem II stability/assembly factor-like uncharacterized protein
MKNIKYIFLILILWNCTKSEITPKIQQLESPTQALLQAISIVDENTAWISGHNATFVLTKDGGANWQQFNHPTGDSLQFRDVHGFNKNKAVLMSAGSGSLSRIFTFTAPDQWEENFVMQDSLGFLDCIDFWDDQRGIAYGDAIDNYPYILLTSDGGKSWSRADSTNMPKAGKGEGGFAASGTCVTTGVNGKAWVATGAGGNCRFLVTEDYGQSWRAVASPLIKGDAAGNTSVSFVNNMGVVTGGDLLVTDDYTENCAFSTDGGDTWNLSNQPQTLGAFYGSAITQVGDQTFAFACGPNGIDYTDDTGETWNKLDSLNYWAVSIKGNKGYASGRGGKILRISLQP